MLKELHSPSSSLVKDRLVVSSFRFLLKSMHRLLSFFLMVLISCHSKKREVRSDLILNQTLITRVSALNGRTIIQFSF